MFYTKKNVFRTGASYTYAHGAPAAAGEDVVGNLHSVSGGVTTTVSDRLILGVSFTYNGDTGLARKPGSTFASAAFGYAASLNYNVGPWTVGGYYQRARSEGDTAVPGADLLRAVELGGSYRFNRRMRIYGAGYLYRFRNEGGPGAATGSTGRSCSSGFAPQSETEEAVPVTLSDRGREERSRA